MNLVEKLTKKLYYFNDRPLSHIAGARGVLAHPETVKMLNKELTEQYAKTMYTYTGLVGEMAPLVPHKLEFHGLPVFSSTDIEEGDFHIL